MPQFWIAIFFILLAVAQLYESVKEIELPLPVYLVLGTVLAIASNSHQKFGLSLDRLPIQVQPQVATPILPNVTAQLLTSAEHQDIHELNLVD
jgi:hypothetical protein